MASLKRCSIIYKWAKGYVFVHNDISKNYTNER